MRYFNILLITTILVTSGYAKPSRNSTETTKVTGHSEYAYDEVPRQGYGRCYNYQFECSNGQCIHDTLVCNGRQDCRDGSDEDYLLCRNRSPSTTTTTTTERYSSSKNSNNNRPFDPQQPEITDRLPCGLNEFTCMSGGCISQARVCDGFKDCADGSDESRTICPSVPTNPGNDNNGNNSGNNNGGNNGNNGIKQCKPSEFRCKDSECISIRFVCDGTVHCRDGSDENTSLCQGSNGNNNGNNNNGNNGGNNGGNNNGNNGGNNGGNNNGNNGGNNAGNNNGNSNWQQKLTPCSVPQQPSNGLWKLHRSLCNSGLECMVPSNVRTMDPGTYLVYTCDPGYVLNGSRDVLCGPGGKWIHEPRCEEITCPVLSSSTTEALCKSNGLTISCEVPVPIGTTGQLNCRKGFVQEISYTPTSKNVTCGHNGIWNPKPIKCVKKPKKVKLILEGDMIIEE